MLNSKALAASASAPKVYVEDVFSTWLYTGNGSTQTITNGIDLSGKGGLVWCKARSNAYDHVLGGPDLGTGKLLSTNAANGTQTFNSFSSFNSDGFTLGNLLASNGSGVTESSWTFRKQAKFFDVVTYTGNGSNRTISHSLGSVPGCIIVKRTDTTGDWQVYHRANTANPETDYLVLNSTAATADSDTRWNDTLPTSTVFSLGTEATVNASGGTYVAYLFAHDAGGFGDSGNDSAVNCGSFTASAGTGTINLGYEPQWVLLKRTDAAQDWYLVDVMRGQPVTTASGQYLRPNSSSSEFTGGFIYPTATGFQLDSNAFGSGNNGTYIYIAIRRGPMKTPTSGTEVFAVSTKTGNGSFTSNFPVDMAFSIATARTAEKWIATKLSGSYLSTSSTASEISGTTYFKYDSNTTFQTVGFWPSGDPNVCQMFRRAPGFFDVVAYTGTGSARTVSHNLGVTPELMIVKKRSAADNWVVYAGDATDYLILNTTAATADLDTMWNDTAPTSAVFSLGTNDDVNGNTATFIAYLFATLSGVSKVGSYTGTGTTLDINCGFTAGARFVLIKRTDSTGDWYVWDTARGIVSGNDPYLLLNSNAVEVTNTDFIDPLSSGFQISSTAPAAINANGGTFIYLAIA
jgi:hypothetical protein